MVKIYSIEPENVKKCHMITWYDGTMFHPWSSAVHCVTFVLITASGMQLIRAVPGGDNNWALTILIIYLST